MTLLILGAVLVLIYFTAEKVYDKLWDKNLVTDIKFRDDCAFEGEKTELIEVISNNKALPLPALEIDFHLGRGLRFTNSSNSTVSDKLYRRDVFSLGAKKRITRRLELACAKRGYYTLDFLGITGRDLFLTHKYVGSLKLFREFFVYPRRVSSRQIQIPYNRIMGELLSRERLFPDPFAFGGIRDYMISDPMKYINWKASARSGKLVTNLHDSSLSQKVTLVIDTYENASPVDAELNEESIRIGSDLCARIMESGISLTLLGNGEDLLSGERLCLTELRGLGIDQVRRTLARLICTEKQKADGLLEGAETGNNTLMVLVSKNLDCAQALCKIGGDAIWICPYRLEKPEPPAGKFTFIPWQDESPMY